MVVFIRTLAGQLVPKEDPSPEVCLVCPLRVTNPSACPVLPSCDEITHFIADPIKANGDSHFTYLYTSLILPPQGGEATAVIAADAYSQKFHKAVKGFSHLY